MSNEALAVKIDALAELVKAISKKLDGNGQKGLIDRMGCVESDLKHHVESTKDFGENLKTLVTTVKQVSDDLADHLVVVAKQEEAEDKVKNTKLDFSNKVKLLLIGAVISNIVAVVFGTITIAMHIGK